MCNPKVGQRYFFMQSTIPHAPNDYFLKNKPADSYRIFVLGASTTAGFPYGNGLMFSRILQRRLQDTFPNRTIEMINTAMTAVNSYTILDILNEIIEQKPDALLFYAGHNEYYGALGVASIESLGRYPWIIHLFLKLQRYKTFILLRNCIGRIKKSLFGSQETDLSATLMQRIVSQEEIPMGSSLYHQGIIQFRTNLSAIIKKVKKAGIPLILSELISNVHDQPPFCTNDSSASAEAWRYFHNARELESENLYHEAANNYLEAKEWDPVRFRAPEAFNTIINTLARENNIPVVPMQKYFKNNSPHQLIGDNLMIDHLHPNIDGYFLMADGFYQTMRQQEFIVPVWPQDYIKSNAYYRKIWAITDIDTKYVDLLMHHLKAGWPFKPKTVQNNVLINYKPRTKVDTLVKEIIYDEMNLAKAHLQLANYYKEKNDLAGAELEFRALFQILNEDDVMVMNRVDILIAHKEFEQALHLLFKMTESHESALALKRIGQIYMDTGHTHDALPFLESALKESPDDDHLLYLLARGYAADIQTEKAIKYLTILKSRNPTHQGLPYLEKLIDRALNKEIR